MATEMKSQDSQTPSLYLWSATELQKQARFRMLHGAEWGFLQKKKKNTASPVSSSNEICI